MFFNASKNLARKDLGQLLYVLTQCMTMAKQKA